MLICGVNKMKILLVDDSKAIHSLVSEMLSEFNQIDFQHAYNGQEAVDIVSSDKFDADLILLDWEMPELNGIDALPLLRKRRIELPIMMMTSKNSMSDVSDALDKGATEYMMKPFTKDILIGKITEIMGKEVTLL
jgi:two-component system chemotaxis response regulator CheY